MDFKVIPALPEHASEIAQVHMGSWHTTYQGIVADTTLAKINLESRTQQWRERLSDPKSQTCTFVAVDENNQSVGFAAGGPSRSEKLQSDAELYAIYLYKESQRRGIGKALFSAVARYLADVGFQSISVWVLELNPSRLFYEFLGGERIVEQLLERDGLTLKELGYRWQSLRLLLERLS